MFNLLGEFTDPPFAMGNIAKIHRGMNQVNVSVGEHMSEPSEVYVVTAEEGKGAELSTFVVFFLEDPRIRIVYGSDDNPYSTDRRIEVESEAIEFIEEMGAIVEDIAWEEMDPKGRGDWLAKQPLFPSGEEPQADEVEDLSEEALILEVEEPEEMEYQVSEAELEEDEELEVEQDDAPAPGGEGPAKSVIDDSVDKVVLVEERFDEMLEQAFLKKPGEASAARVEIEEEGGVLIKAEVGDMPVQDEQTTVSGDTAEDQPEPSAPPVEIVSPAPSEFVPAPSGEDETLGDDQAEAELRRKVLRFLSKM